MDTKCQTIYKKKVRVTRRHDCPLPAHSGRFGHGRAWGQITGVTREEIWLSQIYNPEPVQPLGLLIPEFEAWWIRFRMTNNKNPRLNTNSTGSCSLKRMLNTLN